MDVTVDGEPLAVYNFGRSLPKPFLGPVRGPGGATVTRRLEGAQDHPHQKGVWISSDEVNGVRFWVEEGKIQNAAVSLIVPEGDPAHMDVVNHWLAGDGTPILVEKTAIRVYSNRLLTYDVTFTAGKRPVTFGDTKNGLFGIRVADSMTEKQGGHVVNADGLKEASACWGQRSDWVDYYGQVDGQTVGVALFDHPQNSRPSRYQVRDYGLFSLSPFGESAYTNGKQPPAPLALPAGESLRLRYGLYVHAGDAETADVGETYARYIGLAK